MLPSPGISGAPMPPNGPSRVRVASGTAPSSQRPIDPHAHVDVPLFWQRCLDAFQRGADAAAIQHLDPAARASKALATAIG